MHDVAVVGAGPAGGMTAWRLAEADLDVLLLEKRDVIGQPVACGEAMSVFALENNGIPQSEEFYVRSVKGIRIISPDGNNYTEAIPGICIRRDRLDNYIVERAREAGAEVRVGTKVAAASYDGTWRLSTEDAEVEARVIVAADGPRSEMGRSQGLEVQERVAGAAQYTFSSREDIKDDHLRFYGGEDYSGGYAWSFDRGEEVHVGVVTTGSPRSILDSLCDRIGMDPDDRTSMTGGAIPQGGPNPALSAKALVTVGDAAGLINPCSAGGIHAALHSGRLAAEHIVDAFSRKEPTDLSSYEKAIRETPFCDPALIEARAFMDGLTDEQWNFIVKSLQERDVSKLMSIKVLKRLMVNSPFALPQIWSLRTLGKAFRSYGTWGW
ncbi:MAG: NAD(P)/FAD-dependent oxidoreductase [Thermoplasmata archaeon]|nr:MAG: NAD(P)/FAD-dependent oxidoreductase [Thermoplasmata archaeon]